MAQQGSQESNATPNESIDRIGDAALNPAIVFTANRYKFNSSTGHRYVIYNCSVASSILNMIYSVRVWLVECNVLI